MKHPKEKAMDAPRPSYDVWMTGGHIRVTPGLIVDQALILSMVFGGKR